mmetsp:Transcript_28441/g.82332  ORF Transcript_28441/g.82332 Transcript_28441/m.82332 type:complete len:390 (+) Transcript_28441:328-1497(+)
MVRDDLEEVILLIAQLVEHTEHAVVGGGHTVLRLHTVDDQGLLAAADGVLGAPMPMALYEGVRVGTHGHFAAGAIHAGLDRMSIVDERDVVAAPGDLQFWPLLRLKAHGQVHRALRSAGAAHGVGAGGRGGPGLRIVRVPWCGVDNRRSNGVDRDGEAGAGRQIAAHLRCEIRRLHRRGPRADLFDGRCPGGGVWEPHRVHDIDQRICQAPRGAATGKLRIHLDVLRPDLQLLGQCSLDGLLELRLVRAEGGGIRHAHAHTSLERGGKRLRQGCRTTRNNPTIERLRRSEVTARIRPPHGALELVVLHDAHRSDVLQHEPVDGLGARRRCEGAAISPEGGQGKILVDIVEVHRTCETGHHRSDCEPALRRLHIPHHRQLVLERHEECVR